MAEDVLLLGLSLYNTSGGCTIHSARPTMVHLGYSGLYCRMIRVRLSQGAVHRASSRLALEWGPECGGHASGRHTGLCSGLPERYYYISFYL